MLNPDEMLNRRKQFKKKIYANSYFYPWYPAITNVTTARARKTALVNNEKR